MSHTEAITGVIGRKPTLLVIDEAHRMTELAQHNEEIGGLLSWAARESPSLLLLTATPMHSGSAGFLHLLSLVDPEVYRAGDAESFNRRLQMRQIQASKIELLQPGVPSRTVLGILAEFAAEYGRDDQLRPLLEEARRSMAHREADRDQHLAAVADYLRETYRISRRVIRHRRDAARTRGYPYPAGNRRRWTYGIRPAQSSTGPG